MKNVKSNRQIRRVLTGLVMLCLITVVGCLKPPSVRYVGYFDAAGNCVQGTAYDCAVVALKSGEIEVVSLR